MPWMNQHEMDSNSSLPAQEIVGYVSVLSYVTPR